MPHLGYRDVVLRSTDAIVYLEYKPNLLPPKPSGIQDERWTRFVCLSDTHAHTFDVPDGDVLLHAGDLTNLGAVSEFEKTMEWLYALPHGVKMLVRCFLSNWIANIIIARKE
jgi:predicted phosphohydrolase